jgi:hypothetical protein
VTRRRRAAVPVMALVALGVGLAEPYAEIAWKCRAGFEGTEACVWGRALLPLGRWVALVVITPVCFLLLLAVDWGWRRLAGPPASDEGALG